MSKLKSENINKAALQVFFNISGLWGLNENQEKLLLGNPDERKFVTWKHEKSEEYLDEEVLLRVSYIMGIYKSLNELLPTKEAANSWIHQNNSASLFDGKSALEKILKGDMNDMIELNDYLKSIY